MTPELADILIDKYRPLFYRSETERMESFGIQCGDGWYDILDRALADMSEYDVLLTQVKEKWGQLRIYYVLITGQEGDLQDVDDIVDRAEWESQFTCEECGAPGTLKNEGWMVTLCDSCNKEDWR